MDLQMDDEFAITVSLTDRPDGGVGVTCSDLPGLILSGSDKAAVINAIPTAIRLLLEHAGFEVAVHHKAPIADLLKRKLPVDVDLHVQPALSANTFIYTVELRNAA